MHKGVLLHKSSMSAELWLKVCIIRAMASLTDRRMVTQVAVVATFITLWVLFHSFVIFGILTLYKLKSLKEGGSSEF